MGQNKIAIPKFDPDVIEKYNKLNIEGKLPHIVETNKFDPLAVKQQVKDMFAHIKTRAFDADKIASDPNSVFQRTDNQEPSGIGN